MAEVDLRAATAADLELTYDITEAAMRGAVEQTWGRWDEVEQRLKHRTNFDPNTTRIVVVDGADAGLLTVEDQPDHVWLVKLYLRPGHQGRGIGSALLRGVLQRADGLGLPVRLRVLRVNLRAQALYARHGFVVMAQTAERCVMQRPASALAPQGLSAGYSRA